MAAPANRPILVVEDEFASLEVLALLLTSEGYVVLTASDGEEALQRLAGDQVALVITDYMMPKMNGLELCARMRGDERLRDIPVILMSAIHRDDIPADPQVVAHVSKPLLFEKLHAAVRKVLSQRG